MFERKIWLIPVAALLLLTGCNDSEGDGDRVSVPNNPDTLGNQAPNISGNPSPAVNIGDQYSFTPSASDPDGDELTFNVQGLPGWASFSSSTGRITGTPSMADEGSYGSIAVSVTDGKLSTSLPTFSIDAVSASLGSVTLSWTPPTMNEDGTVLTDLASYKIYYGVAAGNYPSQVRIDNPGISTYVVDNLAPNTYYFVSTAINASGVESSYSNMATKTVN
jgi:hypothetical protein